MKRLANSLKLKRLAQFLCAAVALVMLTACPSDPIDTTGNLVGTVTDARTGELLKGVSVSLSPTGKTYTTGVDGKFEFRNIESQQYTVTVDKTDYLSDKKTAFVKPSEDTNLDFQLTPATGELSLSQTTLDFGDENTSMGFDIENKGSALLKWEFGKFPEWISCSKTSGELQGHAKTTIVVSIKRDGLERGNYSHTVTVTSDGGSAVLNVKMTVSGLDLKFSATELDFGASTSSIDLVITNNKSGDLKYSVMVSKDWIKTEKKQGTISKTEIIPIAVERSGLSVGDYSGTANITVEGEPYVISVKMAVPDKKKPVVNLNVIGNIEHDSASAYASIVSTGGAAITQHGFCISEKENPTIDNSTICKLGNAANAGDYNYTFHSLKASTKYYVRAYCENSEGLSYSNQLSFKTYGQPTTPDVVTGGVHTVEAYKAIVSGEITNIGNVDEITQYGHVWSTKKNPTVSDSKTRIGSTSQLGTFQSTLTDLKPNTTYYVKAYAENQVGVAYGAEKEFTTSYGDIILRTENASSLTYNSAVLQGKVTQDGGHAINEFGFCYGSSSNPTVSGMKVKGTGSKDSFKAEIKGLKESSTYYAKSYVLYDSGECAYGNEVKFVTKAKDIHIDKTGYEDDANWSKK